MATLQTPSGTDVVGAAVGAGVISLAHAAAHSRYGDADALGPAAVGTAGIAVAGASFLTLLAAKSIQTNGSSLY